MNFMNVDRFVKFKSSNKKTTKYDPGRLFVKREKQKSSIHRMSTTNSMLAVDSVTALAIYMYKSEQQLFN